MGRFVNSLHNCTADFFYFAYILGTMNRLLSIILIFFAFSTVLSAQEAPNLTLSKYQRKGEEALLAHDYRKARQWFEKVLHDFPEYCAAIRGVGATYALEKDYRTAAKYYSRILDLDPQFSRALYFETAEAYYKCGDYDRALGLFRQYEALLQNAPESFRINGPTELAFEANYQKSLPRQLQACVVAMDSSQFLHIQAVSNLSGINTEHDEYFPFLSNDQNRLYFTTRKAVGDDEDLHISRRNGADWSSGHPAGRAFNTGQNEGMTTLVRDGRKLYFTACQRESVMGSCDIWEADLEAGNIEAVRPLAGWSNSDRWESQASISCDGGALYFASNREGGLGGTDIWVSYRRSDGLWGRPENLGPSINTDQDEEAPFITNDGQILYFSSTGHPGMGEQDLFFSRLGADGRWSDPVNLGPPVNSSYRELGFFLSADNRTGYFASDRPNGKGGMDIYQFELPAPLTNQPIVFVEGYVRDSITQKPLPGVVVIAPGNPDLGSRQVRSDSTGRFFVCLPATYSFTFKMNLPVYLPYQQTIPLPEWTNESPFPLEIWLSPLHAPRTKPQPPVAEPPPLVMPARSRSIVKYLHTTFFAFDDTKLSVQSIDGLTGFCERHLGKAIQKIEVIGYADYIGTDAYNMQLSEDRAKSVAVWMKEHGLPVDRVFIEGRGELNDGQPASQNRKVDVIIWVEVEN